MSARNRFFILLGIIFVIAAGYYYFSTNHTNDLVLIGTVDANQVIVSAQVEGRIQKLLVDEGTPVKAGDLIAVLDPSELQAQEAAATATVQALVPASLRGRFAALSRMVSSSIVALASYAYTLAYTRGGAHGEGDLAGRAFDRLVHASGRQGAPVELAYPCGSGSAI